MPKDQTEKCEACEFRESNIGYPSPCPSHAVSTPTEQKCEHGNYVPAPCCYPVSTSSTLGWEKEFDNKFCTLYGIKVYEGDKLFMGTPEVEDVKNFIRSLLSKERAEIREKVRELMKEPCSFDDSENHWYQKALLDLLAKLDQTT